MTTRKHLENFLETNGDKKNSAFYYYDMNA